MSRGLIANPGGNQLFIVVSNKLFSVAPNGVRVLIGTLLTRVGPVGMRIGLTQLVVVDGSFGYVYDLLTKTFSRITSAGFLGSYTVEYIGGYFSFIQPKSQTFYLSASEDATTIDPLDFATANNSPDTLVGQLTTSNVILYMGQVGIEVWQINPNPSTIDLALERNSGTYIEVGLLAPFTAKDLDNTAYWLGRDERGSGIVYKMQGLAPTRISTMAIEQKIYEAMSAGNDISQAAAYTYQQGGHSFYALQIPGLKTTWVYDAASNEWHERAEFLLGVLGQHRGRFHAFCYGKNLICGDDDKIYAYDPNANTNAGDVLVRQRTSPHYATPGLDRVSFTRFELDCVVGYGVAGQSAATVQLRYSDDGGFSWGSWRQASLGAVGEKKQRARFLRCGSARDRVWEVRCTDDVPFAIINAIVESA